MRETAKHEGELGVRERAKSMREHESERGLSMRERESQGCHEREG